MAGLLLTAGGWDANELRFFWTFILLQTDRPATTEEVTSSYRRFLNIVKKRGIRKLPSETPREFAEKIGSPVLGELAIEFTRLYNATRYGGQRPSLPVLKAMLHEISAASARPDRK